MRPLRSLLIYVALVFLGGALIAPCLYWLAQWAAGHWPALSSLAARPFYRFLDRALLGLALLCLWPLLRRAGARSWRDVGFVPQRRPGLQILRGFALGWASLAAVALLAIACGARAFTLTHTAPELLRSLANATWAAVVVAILEELVFRGALYGILRQSIPWPAALALSSAVYSAVHFIQKAGSPLPVHWYSGIFLLWRMFTHGPPMIPSFLTLLVAGAILALAYQRTGALYFSIGLHAGWIFWLKSYRYLSHPLPANSSFWGGDELVDGWLSFLALAVILTLIVRQPPQSPPAAPGG